MIALHFVRFRDCRYGDAWSFRLRFFGNVSEHAQPATAFHSAFSVTLARISSIRFKMFSFAFRRILLPRLGSNPAR
ncbi:hypothetical protein Oant_2222 [Brucella anthropi ATCC 49188]|uniref:Uncharacterized protein n=1 Tax=Brucella anthropi (strain ATCC 49188 / DSM 6882 / CCUG 24695 / JCM 21032 / LMG 3331 / NBRC 15819 / NCTC 12168 / Alc 37) TaxID=439375 RepID=A6X134_BRUA4|nr:hypothetical protein Oant_2222 [Brucella anthropi ATCC 49188]